MENNHQYRLETDSLGEIRVPIGKLWGAQTQRCLAYFSIGKDLLPQEMIHAYAVVKKAAAKANYQCKTLNESTYLFITQVCDEILAGQHLDMFPLHVWMTGSGTSFNMNMNEVISNRACQLAGTEMGSKTPVHPNAHANKAQSSNDTFPTAMHIAAAEEVVHLLVPSLNKLANALNDKKQAFKDIIKIGRTHTQDATPLTLGQEFSGYVSQLDHGLRAINNSLAHLSELALGGTAVGTGINTPKGYSENVAKHIATLTGLPTLKKYGRATNKHT